MLKWKKDKHAPIPDYQCLDGYLRIFKVEEVWKLQQTMPIRYIIDFFHTLPEAKQAAENIWGNLPNETKL